MSHWEGGVIFGGGTLHFGGYVTLGDLAMTTFNRQGGREVGTPPTTPVQLLMGGVLLLGGPLK